MEYLELEERPDLARAQASTTENIVDVGEDGKPAFYIAISQMLDTNVGWLSSPPRPIASGSDIEAILERVWMLFSAQRECSSQHTMRWHVYRIEGQFSWLVQKFEVFSHDAVLVDFDKWSQEIDDRNAAIEKADSVKDRRAAMKMVGREVP